MEKAIQTAKWISKNLETNCLPNLEESNLHKVFEPIFRLNYPIGICNTIVAYIIFAYDNNSAWINLNADRLDDKVRILKSLEADISDPVYSELVSQQNAEIENVVAEYLIAITNWKWRTILTCFDYHAINIRIATEFTKSNDELDAAKINKAKGDLLKEAIRQREVGENLLREIKSEYVKTDRATQQDFGFEVTDEKKIKIESWRDYIRERNRKKTINS